MPLSKIQFRPGVNRETTSYGDENGWYNSDLVRFRKGRPEKMGVGHVLAVTRSKGLGALFMFGLHLVVPNTWVLAQKPSSI